MFCCCCVLWQVKAVLAVALPGALLEVAGVVAAQATLSVCGAARLLQPGSNFVLKVLEGQQDPLPRVLVPDDQLERELSASSGRRALLFYVPPDTRCVFFVAGSGSQARMSCI